MEEVEVRSTSTDNETDWLLVALIIAVALCTICSVCLLFLYVCCKAAYAPQQQVMMPQAPQYQYVHEAKQPVYVMPGEYSQDMSMMSQGGKYYSGSPEKFIRLDSAGSRGSFAGHRRSARATYVGPETHEVVIDDNIRLQLAQVLSDQGFDAESFASLCDGKSTGTVEKVELVLALKNLGGFKIDQILQLSKILLPSAVDSTANFRAKLDSCMADYQKSKGEGPSLAKPKEEQEGGSIEMHYLDEGSYSVVDLEQ